MFPLFIMDSTKIIVYDNTIETIERYGHDIVPGKKIEIAKMLEAMNVDVIGAGFPIRSPNDRETVQGVSETCHRATISALARCSHPSDIDQAWQSVASAARPRLHVFQTTRGMRGFEVCMSEKQVIESAITGVRHAKGLCDDVQFSAEDTTLLDPGFARELYREAAIAGATTVNVVDPPITLQEMLRSPGRRRNGDIGQSRMRDTVETIVKAVKGMDVMIGGHCYGPADPHMNAPIAPHSAVTAVHAAEEGARQLTCCVRGPRDIDQEGNPSITSLSLLSGVVSVLLGNRFRFGVTLQDMHKIGQILKSQR